MQPGLQGEFELEAEFEQELEGEFELESEGEAEFEGEFEGEMEGEQFLRRLRRLASRAIRVAAPALRTLAPLAGRAVGMAVGGPIGAQLGARLGQAAGSALREGEFEAEFEGEFEGELELEGELEGEGEFELEGEGEGELEFEGEFESMAPATSQQALGELMAAAAAQAESEAEAEAFVGAATVASLSPRERAALRRVLPNLVRGAALLLRLMRRRRGARVGIRTIPTIVRRTARTLSQRSAGGRPVTRGAAARAMSTQTRRVLGSPRASAAALQRNMAGTRAVARPRQYAGARRTPGSRAPITG